jgi:hypothetical protein
MSQMVSVYESHNKPIIVLKGCVLVSRFREVLGESGPSGLFSAIGTN